MTFNVTRLLGNRAAVSGTDSVGTSGSTILDTTEWYEIQSNRAYNQSVESFDEAVAAFFAPLTEAAEKVGSKVQRDADPASYIVLEEEVAPVPGKPGQLLRLNRDSIILRLIEQGDTDRLLWIGGNLEVTDMVPPAVPTSGTVVEAATEVSEELV